MIKTVYVAVTTVVNPENMDRVVAGIIFVEGFFHVSHTAREVAHKLGEIRRRGRVSQQETVVE